MANQVTLQDLAERAGVHRSTVSLALRDHPRISPAVRQRIQALAKEMGYRVNPLVAALMHSRRSGAPLKHVALAYVTNYPTRWGWRPPHHDRPDYFPGAAARAEELGFKLEHFWMREPGMTPERFCDILLARGITGMIIGRLPPGEHTLPLQWERFSAVCLGFTMHQPLLHRVAEDFFDSSRRVMDNCIAAGYRRIGVAFTDANDSPQVGDRWLGAYLRQQLLLSPKDRLPPFLFAPDTDPMIGFREWVRKHKPDALIVTHVNPAIEWLENMGLRVPQDIALVTMNKKPSDENIAGVYCDPAKLGSVAVEMLTGLQHRNEVGPPSDPHEVLLTGEWVDGASLPRRR